MPHTIIAPPEGYVTLQQLLDYLQQQPSEVLAGPLLFTRLGNYDNEEACPVKILLDSWHPADAARTLHYNTQDGEYSRFEPDTYTVTCERPLGQLPWGCPVLHFSDQDDDLPQRNKWLKKHLQQPAPLPAPTPPAHLPDLFAPNP